MKVKESEEGGKEMPMPRNCNDILIIHVGEHGSQNTIVHVKKPTVLFKNIPTRKKCTRKK